MATENNLYGNQRIFGDLVVDGITKLPSVVIGMVSFDNELKISSATNTMLINADGLYIGGKKVLVDGDYDNTEIDLSGYLPITGGNITGNITAKIAKFNELYADSIIGTNLTIGDLKLSYVPDIKSLSIPADLMVNGHRVYTTDYKPTINDIGAVSSSGGIINGNLSVSGVLEIGEITTPASLAINAKNIILNASTIAAQATFRSTLLFEGNNRVYSNANPPPRDPDVVRTNGSTKIVGTQRISVVDTDKLILSNSSIVADINGISATTKLLRFLNPSTESIFAKNTITIDINPVTGSVNSQCVSAKTVNSNSYCILNKEVLISSGSTLKLNPTNGYSLLYTGTSTLRHDGIFQIGSNGSVLSIDPTGKMVLNGNLDCSFVSVTNNIDAAWGELTNAGYEMSCSDVAGAKWLTVAKTATNEVRFGIQTSKTETRFYQGTSYIRLVDGVLYTKSSTDLASVPTVKSVKDMLGGLVQNTVTINGQPLTKSINLTAESVGAASVRHAHQEYYEKTGGVLGGSIEFENPSFIKFIGKNSFAKISSDVAGELDVTFSALTLKDCGGNELVRIDDTGAVSVTTELKIGTNTIYHSGNSLVWKGYSTSTTADVVSGETYAVIIKRKDDTISYTVLVTKTDHAVGAIDVSSVCYGPTGQRLCVEIQYLNETSSKFIIRDTGVITTDYVITMIKVV